MSYFQHATETLSYLICSCHCIYIFISVIVYGVFTIGIAYAATGLSGPVTQVRDVHLS